MLTENNRQNCKIVVLGANGGIGNQAVLQALNAGYKVTAILRSPEKLQLNHPSLTIMKGDVMLPGTLDEALRNTDVVISAIGSNSLKATSLYSQGNKNLIESMRKVGVNRAFFISASGLEVNPTHSFVVRLATKYLLQVILRNMYADLWRMEKILKGSSINWTIIRPPRLLDGAGTGKYRVAINGCLDNGLKISRADVAHYIINNINEASTVGKTIEVAY
ncbi:MAG TPA: SDR family oxidoreductase [Chitinophaga sp.]|uniref:NAD(P)-dependent oxidoreductase n=1 Tax=Chitinophaga sp. TaxID=1869181 RepID=UPI002C882E19|nr:SDR family oxidoreductase [Chitinophaga sp.]HVI44678.1 SDR family oxidoreductase [Chitinophaga sp.]